MIFTEGRFLIFFAVALAVAWSLRHNGLRKGWLLLCSYAFYAAWDWRFLGLIALSTAIDFVAGAMLGRPDPRGGRRAWLGVSLAANLCILGFFKYFGFFLDSAVDLLELAGFRVSVHSLSIVLPVGISFFTFQSMSYTIDVYRGRMRPVGSLLDFALFVGFFPQLVAGPIVRAAGFLPQLERAPAFAEVELRRHLTLFWLGFVKKACIADHIAAVIDPVYETPALYSAASQTTAVLLYPVQLYCDFSGYSDMAIASAGLLGYRLTRNFDFPYLARSIRELWSRWHISLSTWFRDYLYIPLGGNHGPTARTASNLGITFLLIGLWHGAAWTFVLFGAVHAAVVIGEQLGGDRLLARLPAAVCHGYVLAVWTFSIIVFRSPDVGVALGMIGDILSWSPGPPAAVARALDPAWLVLPAAFLAVHAALARWRPLTRLDELPDWLFALGFGAAVALTPPWIATVHQPFIYFQF